MAQNDFSIANQGFPSFRADLNDALQSLASQSSGSTAPPSPAEYQWWFDTSSDVLKVYNPGTGIWIDFATFNLTTNTWTLEPENINGVVASASNLNATQYLSNRNLIINGSGRINQRGYVSGTTTSGANQYTLDRWRVVVSGESLSFSGDDAGRTMTAPAGGVEQEIEGENILNQTYTISFSGTATCTIGGVTKASGDTVTLTKNTNTTVRFSGGTFSDVQLELGDVVTPFEKRSIGQELALCQRYYEKSHRLEIAPGGTTADSDCDTIGLLNTNLVRGTTHFRVVKRTSPSVTTWAQNGSTGNITLDTGATGTFEAGSLTSSITSTRFVMDGNIDSGDTFKKGTFAWAADAEL